MASFCVGKWCRLSKPDLWERDVQCVLNGSLVMVLFISVLDQGCVFCGVYLQRKHWAGDDEPFVFVLHGAIQTTNAQLGSAFPHWYSLQSHDSADITLLCVPSVLNERDTIKWKAIIDQLFFVQISATAWRATRHFDGSDEISKV